VDVTALLAEYQAKEIPLGTVIGRLNPGDLSDHLGPEIFIGGCVRLDRFGLGGLGQPAIFGRGESGTDPR
jgi:hypothetical protein